MRRHDYLLEIAQARSPLLSPFVLMSARKAGFLLWRVRVMGL